MDRSAAPVTHTGSREGDLAGSIAPRTSPAGRILEVSR